MLKNPDGHGTPPSISASRKKETVVALKELLWSLLWVNLFVAVAGVLVGRRLENVKLGLLVYFGAGLLCSAVVLVTFGSNIVLALLLEWRDRHLGQ